jgi:hypothetical protein
MGSQDANIGVNNGPSGSREWAVEMEIDGNIGVDNGL